MKGTVNIFPGQGSQYAGMISTAAPLSENEKGILAMADEVLGTGLTDLMEKGPEEELIRTENAQPALLLMGFLYGRRAEAKHGPPAIVAGHSLGEYTALVQAGVLDLEDGLNIVRKRGELMAGASEKRPGGMLAVLRGNLEAVLNIITEEYGPGILEVANYNSPDQFVLTGRREAIREIEERINRDKLGIGRELKVSAPFHSTIMEPVAGEFGIFLKGYTFKQPATLFIDNVTGEPEEDPEKIREKLILQLHSPVQWEKTVIRAYAEGGRTFIECGPGRVLSGLLKRTLKGIEIVTGEQDLKGE